MAELFLWGMGILWLAGGHAFVDSRYFAVRCAVWCDGYAGHSLYCGNGFCVSQKQVVMNTKASLCYLPEGCVVLGLKSHHWLT